MAIYQHTIIGAKIIAPIKKLEHVAPLIEYSHENYDGTGYPHKAKGEEIPLGARVIRVVDSFSAMIDERPYKQSRGFDDAIKEIKAMDSNAKIIAITALYSPEKRKEVMEAGAAAMVVKPFDVPDLIKAIVKVLSI